MANHRACFAVVALLVLASSNIGCEKKKAPVAADPQSMRSITSGTVVGHVGEYGGHVWLGLPYAKPPVGDLRWRAPQPPAPWKGTREALAFGSACMQYASPLGGVEGTPGKPTGTEDCLYANIYAPRFAPEAVPQGSARLPVMLWIHGGGNTIGEGAFYNGGNLAVSHNVVVVTFNYRLGPFGWFRHPALRASARNEEDRSGNYGTLDTIRALEWVRDDIAAFGGDPNNVTIFGESAGGMNVYALLLAPAAKGLFHRAIVQSGSLRFDTNAKAENLATADPPGDANSSSETVARLLVKGRLADGREAALARLATMRDGQIESYLRGRSSLEILEAYEPSESTGMISMPNLFCDGVVLPQEEPHESLASGRYNVVPTMIGTNLDENKLFMFGDPKWVRRTLWVFWRLRDERMYNLTAEYLAKWWKADGADDPAAAMRAVQGPSVYVYRFDWDEEPTILGADLGVMLGAAHAFEIPFVFGHFDLGSEGSRLFTAENEPGRKDLSRKMMSYWAAFAANGDPKRGIDGSSTEWTAWDSSDAEAPKFIVFDTEAGGGVRMSSESLTRETVLANLETDARLATQEERCSILRALTAWGRALEEQEYDRRCPDYPLAESES
jgi:para-nitrobenzyl esterase